MPLSVLQTRLEIVVVPAFALAVYVLALLDLGVVFEPPWLLSIVNTLFLSAASLAVAIVATRESDEQHALRVEGRLRTTSRREEAKDSSVEMWERRGATANRTIEWADRTHTTLHDLRTRVLRSETPLRHCAWVTR